MFRRRPPVVILFDVLFIYLFATLTESAPHISILYEGKIPTKYIGFYLHSEAGSRMFVLENGSFLRAQPGMDFYSTFDCEGQTSCESYARKGYEIELIVYGKAMHIISAITTIVCIEQPDQCGRLKFVFNQNGQLDTDRLTRDNPAVKNIKGYASISI